VENLGGWLTTVVARVCLDMLRSRASRREEPLGVRVSDSVAARDSSTDPEHETLLGDSVGLALLVVLETVNGAPGAVWAAGGRPRVVFEFTIECERIVGIDLVADRERLDELDVAMLD
jgi:hypothetical protein